LKELETIFDLALLKAYANVHIIKHP
jgi:hypothetical protein